MQNSYLASKYVALFLSNDFLKFATQHNTTVNDQLSSETQPTVCATTTTIPDTQHNNNK
jgi:hypothetical protein